MEPADERQPDQPDPERGGERTVVVNGRTFRVTDEPVTPIFPGRVFIVPGDGIRPADDVPPAAPADAGRGHDAD
jgi:hypothetical protein